MSRAIKLIEHTYGSHIYMKLKLPNERIEEIDVYLDRNGKETYKTSADKENLEIREQIIDAFNELY